jgi:peroxiredoxin
VTRALALTLFLGACGAAQDAGAGAGATGGRAPDFTLNDLAGRRVHLSDYLGKHVVLVNFWATWCQPCAGELPHLERLYRQYREQGLVVLGVAMDGPETVAQVGPWAQRYGLSFPVLLDEETRVVQQYNPKRAAPFNVMIGRDGAIAKTREGYSAGDEAELEADLKSLLAR